MFKPVLLFGVLAGIGALVVKMTHHSGKSLGKMQGRGMLPSFPSEVEVSGIISGKR